MDRDRLRKIVFPGAGIVTPFNTKSLLLDGANEFVNIDSVQSSLALTTVGTFSLWVKPIDAIRGAQEDMVSFSDTDANTTLQIFKTATSGLLTGFFNIAGTTKWHFDTDVNPFSDNTWIHIALVQDGIEPALYCNGIKPTQAFINDADKTAWFNSAGGIDNGRIGDRNFNSLGEQVHWDGNIDEPIFINRALTQPQIANIYNSGAPKDENGIANGVSYFRMGDKGTFSGGVWTFPDQIGSNDAVTVNCEFEDVEKDTP